MFLVLIMSVYNLPCTHTHTQNRLNGVVTGLVIHLEKTLKTNYDMNEHEMSAVVVVPK